MTGEALALQVKARRRVALLTGKRVRRRKMPKPRQPNALRLSYAQVLKGLSSRLWELVEAELVQQLDGLVRAAGVVHDAAELPAGAGYAARVLAAMARVSERFFAEFTNERLFKMARDLAGRADNFTREELNRQLAAAFGHDLGVNPMAERGMQPRLEAWATENAQLIKNASQRQVDEVSQTALRALREGKRAKEVARDLNERHGFGERRSLLIARDQIGKLTAQLNQARQRGMGVSRFTWVGSTDERECDECLPFEGKTFAWDDPPEAGVPGEIHPNCRCTAEPVVDDVLDQL